jgi:hypothetical protein
MVHCEFLNRCLAITNSQLENQNSFLAQRSQRLLSNAASLCLVTSSKLMLGWGSTVLLVIQPVQLVTTHCSFPLQLF